METQTVAQQAQPAQAERGYPVNRGVRSIAFGVLFAGLGFAYALATSGNNQLTINGTGASRAIGTTCPMVPTEFVTDVDLGNVLAGSLFKREILVRFGISPHTLRLGNIRYGGISISSAGAMSGTPAFPSGTDTTTNTITQVTIAAQIIAVDFSAQTPNTNTGISRIFTLNLQQSTLSTDTITATDTGNSISIIPPLRFVNTPLLTKALTGQKYQFSIQADGGVPPYIFQLADVVSQEAIPDGIVLGLDGTVMGTPTTANLNPPPFTVAVTDGSGSVISQGFILPVVQGPIESALIVTKGTFNLDFSKDGSADSIQLTGVINKDLLSVAGIRKKADLNGIPIALAVGGVVLPQGLTGTGTGTTSSTSTVTQVNTFDQNGRVSFPPPAQNEGDPVPQASTPKYKITLDPASGVLNATFTGVSLINGLNASFRTFRQNIPIEVVIGTDSVAAFLNSNTSTDTATSSSTSTATSLAFDKTSVVSFDYKRTSRIGKGTTNTKVKSNPSGQFIITKVAGTEKLGDGNFDLVQLRFSGYLRLPFGAPVTPNASDVVSVAVGGTANNCIATFPASTLIQANNKLTFTNNDTSIPLHNLTIDNNKGTIMFDTNYLEAFRIFAEDTLDSGEPQLLPIALTFSSPDGKTVSFQAISSVTVFRKGNHLQNK